MKKILITLALAAPILGLHAQLYVGPGETVTVLEGTDVFFGNGTDGVEVDATGLLDVQAGIAPAGTQTNCVIRGNVTGDSRISFGDMTNLDLDFGTWNVEWVVSPATENDEVLNDLTIGTNGEVRVPPRFSLTTYGNFDNSNGFFLEADVTGYAQLLTLGSILNPTTGNMDAQQFIDITKEGWRQLSSPVGGTELGDIADDFEVNYGVITATHPKGTQDSTRNAWWYDASPISPSPAPGITSPPGNGSNSNAVHWTQGTAATDPWGHTQPWDLYVAGSNSVLNGGILDVSGADIGNGDYTFACYRTNDFIDLLSGETNPTLVTGWNLIPNPYPSNIDVSTLLLDGTNFDLAYKAVHVWDAKNQRYIALTADIPSVIEWNNLQVNALDETKNIAPFQAFWVKATPTPNNSIVATEDILLNNSHRTVEDNANFFKTTPPLIRLQVASDNGKYSDQSVLAFSHESTIAVDNNDALKLNSLNGNVPNLSTQAEGINLSINRLPNPDPYHSVPLVVDSRKNGKKMEIDMRDENIDPAWTIYLEDVKTGKMHNLRNGEYSFTHDASMKTNRFVVHINKMPGNVDPSSWNNVSIYANADGINVAFANPDVATAEVTISNLAGQLIYTGTVSTGRVFTFPINEDIALYAVQVVTGTKVTHDKVVK